jgi:hypothetical protein
LNQRAEIVLVRRRQVLVAVLLRELDDRLRPETAVEVVVEQCLGEGDDRLAVHAATRSGAEAARRKAAGRCSQFHEGYSAAAEMQWSEYAWRLFAER